MLVPSELGFDRAWSIPLRRPTNPAAMAERQQQQQQQQPHCSSCKSHKETGECRQEWAAPTLHTTSTRACIRHLLATLLAWRKPTPTPRCDGGALDISPFKWRPWQGAVRRACYQQGCINRVRRGRIGRRNGCWDVEAEAGGSAKADDEGRRRRQKPKASRMGSWSC